MHDRQPPLRIPDICAALECGDKTLRRRLKAGMFPEAYRDGGEWRFPPDTIERYQERKRRETHAYLAVKAMERKGPKKSEATPFVPKAQSA